MENFLINEVKRNWWEQYKRILDEYTLRPGLREDFHSLIFSNKSFRYALKRDMTHAFIKDIDFGCQQQQNQNVCFIGDQGTGKTTAAFILAKMIQERVPEAQIVFAYSLYEALEYIAEGIPAHSIIILDEPLVLHGVGSRIVQDNFYNVFQMCRKYELHFIFNLPQFQQVPNVQIFLELFGIDFKAKRTRLLWRDKRGRYKGLVYFTKNYDEKEFNLLVEQKKDEKWANLVMGQGRHEAIENTESLIEKVVDAIQSDSEYSKISAVSEIKAFCQIRFPEVPDVALSKIAPLVKARLRRKEKKNLEVQVDNYVLQFEEIGGWKDIDFAENILKILADELSNEELEIIRGICAGESYISIAKRVFPSKKCDRAKIFRTKEKVQQRFLGYAGEQAYYNQQTEKRQEIEWGGLNTDEPDFINHTTKEVISFKTGVFENFSKWQREISVNEIRAAERLKYQLVLLGYALKECQFRKFKVLFQPKTPPLRRGGGG